MLSCAFMAYWKEDESREVLFHCGEGLRAEIFGRVGFTFSPKNLDTKFFLCVFSREDRAEGG